jgi:RES domain-containing protein
VLSVYRIAHRKYADAPYSGEGGLHAAGRWSRRGRLVSYAADTLTLATLEMLARARRLTRLKEMAYAPARLHDEAVETLRREDLPSGWDRRPPGRASRDLGEAWLDEAAAIALRVPSVMLPEGANYVLNPAHPDFVEALAVGDARPLDLAARLTERLSSLRS